MKALIQKVRSARVMVDDAVVGKIDLGMLIFLGIKKDDSEATVDKLIAKIVHLRMFPNDDKHFDVSVKESGGSVLIVSQFTLYANCDNGRRPSFDEAATPQDAKKLYELFVEKFRLTGIPTETGVFQAIMQVELVNDGPVTFELEV